jgi:VIT1/CCC1 family predicted Fe2+/Mn2+ transporter
MMTVLAALLMALLASFVLVIAFLACAVTVRAILQGEGPPTAIWRVVHGVTLFDSLRSR